MALLRCWLRVEHFTKFCREHLIQSEDRREGKPLVLEAWQRRMLGETKPYRKRPRAGDVFC